MSTQANISLNDGQLAPVAHVFVAAGTDSKGVAKWFEKTTSAIVSGFFTLTTSLRLDPAAKSPSRFTMKLVIPTVQTETLNGITSEKVTRSHFVNIDVVMPPDSTLQERKDLCHYVADMFSVNTAGMARYSIENLDQVV